MRHTAEVAFCFFALTADLIYRRFHVWAKLLLIARKYSTRREFPSALARRFLDRLVRARALY